MEVRVSPQKHYILTELWYAKQATTFHFKSFKETDQTIRYFNLIDFSPFTIMWNLYLSECTKKQ